MRPFDPRPLFYRATSLQLFHATAGAVHATHSVSIVDPGDDHARQKPGVHRLDLAMHDLDQPDDGHLRGNPSAAHVADLINFVGNLTVDDRLVIHCQAGRRRSTAAAVIADIAHRMNQGARGDKQLVDAAWDDLLKLNPDADPNRALIALGDAALGLDGHLVAKARNMVRYLDLSADAD